MEGQVKRSGNAGFRLLRQRWEERETTSGKD